VQDGYILANKFCS